VGKRVCSEHGCPVLIDKAGRCDTHRRAKDRARGTRQQRGYDADYDAARRADMARLSRGEVLTCWRCGDPVTASDYSLGHCDDDRSVLHGPEHLTRCNLANTRGGCPHASHVIPHEA
jgi:5-methylcytosine-specific restriction endonuclease McrA